MKKLRNILLSVTMILVVILTTACTNKDDTTTKKDTNATKTFVRKQNGVKSTVTYTYIENEDKVLKQTTVNEGVYAELPSAKTKEAVQKVLEPIAKKYQGIKGIKHSIDYQEDKFVENLEIDYENIDYEKAKGILGKDFADPSKTKISMKKTEELLTGQGFKEQK